jgi:hypothetical protein
VPRAPLTDVVPKRTLVILAVVVVLAVLGTVLALTLGGDDDTAGGSKSGGSRTAAGGSASASADTKEDAGSGTRTDGSSAQAGSSSGVTPSNTAAAGGAGSGVAATEESKAATTHKGGQGYSIGLPTGWKYKSSGPTGDRFSGPDGQTLLVAWTTTPKDDPVADWKNQERYMERSEYKRVRIDKVNYRSWNTADWEFTYTEGGTAYRTIDRGFVVNDSLGYALMYTAKSAAWGTDLRSATWTTLADTFTPKK